MKNNYQVTIKKNIFYLSGIYARVIFIALIIVAGSCKKEEVETVTPETGTVTDIDNNIYKTIKIGDQWWMAENLKVTKYRNGNPIHNAQSDNDWIDTVGGYCLYYNNENAPGLLYNWYAIINADNISPAGWHIPSDDEWKTLEKYLGMSEAESNKKGWRGTNEGEKLKIEGTEGWTAYENVWATNESGFTALAGSCRLFSGVWGDPGLFSSGFWWTISASPDNGAWYRNLDYKNAKIFRSYCFKSYGFSVRCVKD